MDNYFAANPISAWFMVAATVCAVLTALVALLRVADETSAARELARLERESRNRNRQAAWLFCTLAADGFFDTRKITDREWMLAASSIERELGR